MGKFFFFDGGRGRLFYFCFSCLLIYISLMCTILYFNFCIHYQVLAIKSWVSICCHAADPLCSPHPAFTAHPSGNRCCVLYICVGLRVCFGLFIYLEFYWFFSLPSCSKTSSTERSGRTYLISDLKGIAFSISPFNMKLAVNLLWKWKY